MIYVVPGAEHLYQMKAVLYEKPYKNPVQQVEYSGFRAIGEREVQGTITVPAAQLEALFAMTPTTGKRPATVLPALRLCRSSPQPSPSAFWCLKSCNNTKRTAVQRTAVLFVK